MKQEAIAKLHGSRKSMILRLFARTSQACPICIDGGLPRRAGEEMQMHTASKGRFYAPKSFAIASQVLVFLFLCLLVQVSANSPYPNAPRDYFPPSNLPSSSFFSSVDMNQLQQRFMRDTPAWIYERIKKELAPFENKKISLKSLDKTFEKFAKTAPLGARYRIIGEKIFRKGPDPYGMDAFFRTIARYADFPGIPDLPNIDIIWNHDDATPLAQQSRDFWVMEDFQDQAPIFTYAVKKNCAYLISMPDRFTLPTWHKLSSEVSAASTKNPWRIKHKKAYWRGQYNDFASLGIAVHDYEQAKQIYSQMPRYQICYLSFLHPDYIDAGFSGRGFCGSDILDQVVIPLNKNPTSPAIHIQYAYLPVLDGYTSTYPGYLWRLLSNSVAFKQESEDSQWFYDALKPYVHYIPVSNHMEDLIEKIEWARHQDKLCKQIANNATRFVENNLMIEDIYLYCFRVFQAYEKCLNFDTKELLIETERDSSWTRIR